LVLVVDFGPKDPWFKPQAAQKTKKKKVHLLGVKLEIRLIFGVIIQFFVCGSEFRARWQVWMKDSCGA
jgi:hypothetical protein